MNVFYKLSIIIFSLMSVSGSPLQSVDTHHAGRCTGSAYCRVCSNCSRCGHCNSGGTCGACAVPQENKPQPKKRTRSTTLRVSPAAELPSRSASPSAQSTDNDLTDNDLEVGTAVYVVNTQLLNVRSGPSTAYPVKYKLSFGEEVKLLEIFDDYWAKIWVETPAGERIVGYVPVSYLSGK